MDVYINYPKPHFTIHGNPQCNQIQKHQKTNQRMIKVTSNNFFKFLTQFINNDYHFASKVDKNDMWLEVNMLSYQQEISFVYIIQAILGLKYKPLSNAPITYHC